MFLTKDEIIRLTGFKLASAQIAFLKGNGFDFDVNGLLEPMLTVAAYEQHLDSIEIGQQIYVIQARDIVKVGITSDITARLKSLRVANPYISEAAFISDRLPDASRIEKLVHQELRQFQVTTSNGPGREWFRCTPRVAIKLTRALIKANQTVRL